MRKGRSVEGLQVIGQEDGTNLGTVKDLIFDHETSEVLGVLVSEKELFGLIDAQVILWNTVRSIGPDAVMVISRESLIRAGDSPRIHEELSGHNSLVGRQINTTDGRTIGAFSDIYFEDDGRIVGYEVSSGLIGDAMSGRRFMPVPTEWTLGEDVALVPPAVAEEMESSDPGGLKGAAAGVQESVSGAYSTAATHVGDAYTSASGSVAETYADVASASVERQKAFVVGKVAARDVVIPAAQSTQSTSNATSASLAATPGEASLPVSSPTMAVTSVEAGAPVEGVTISELGVPTPGTPSDMSSSGEVVEGEVLVRQGETITAAHADRAESAGVLNQLLMAAATGAAQDTLEAQRDRAGAAVAGGTSTASNVGESVQEKAEQAALGKPAGRDVTAPDGSLIVAQGMTVTSEVLSRAKLHGKEKEVIAVAGLGAAAEGVSAGVETVREGASNLWGTIREKAAELTGAASERKAEHDEQAEQKRINDALGRPTNRVILDPQDHVILNAGDLITHAAINRARESGVLEMLLDSVYFVEPEIAMEALRTSEPGEAALQNQVQPAGGPLLPHTPPVDCPPAEGADGTTPQPASTSSTP